MPTAAMLPPQQRWPRGPLNELHLAVRAGSVERTVALLSSALVNVNRGDPDGRTPLMFGAGFGHLSIVRMLLKKGADLSTVDDEGHTALHCSAQEGHLSVVTLLVGAGADPQAASSSGFTPLHYAAQGGHAAVATLLVNADADLEATTSEGATPLLMAADGGHLEAMLALQKAGAEIEAKTCEGWTPLHRAASNGHPETVQAIIDVGVKLDVRDSCGETPLYKGVRGGHLDVVRVLLRARANPLLARTDPRSKIMALPLDAAAVLGHTEVVRELVQHAGIEGCGGASGGADALRLAAQEEHVDIMAVLTDAGVAGTAGALVIASVSNHEAAVKLLLQHQETTNGDVTAFVNTSDSTGGCTPLPGAICLGRGSPRVVRLLVDAGADTASAATVITKSGVALVSNETPLDLTTRMLREVVHGIATTEQQQQHRLEGIRRLLLRVEAVHAVSWLWPNDVPVAGHAVEDAGEAKEASTSMEMTLPILRRRARRHGVLLGALFRYSVKP